MKLKSNHPENNKLTVREREIAQLIADGYTNPMIAKKLNISEHTVNAHRKKIFSKLGVHNIAALVKNILNNND